MTDPISLAVGGALVAGGWIVGRLSRRPRSQTSTPATVCSCEHGYGTHANGGRCQAQTERPNYWADGSRNGYEWVPCPCLAYDGPEPLPRVWTEP